MSEMPSVPRADIQPQLLHIETLDDSVPVAEQGELADLFERARRSAAQAAQERLEFLLPFAVDELNVAEPALRVGELAGPRLLDLDPLVLVELALARASGESAQPARLHSAEGVLEFGAAPHSRGGHPAVEAQVLMSVLSDGWMLEIPGVDTIAPRIARLVADIEAFGDTRLEVLGWYGIRSALGPPPVPTDQQRLLIQLAGRRQVLVTGVDVREQFWAAPGTAALVPPGLAVHHLPLDEDTLHLELLIPREDAPEGERLTRRGLQPARVALRVPLARQIVFGDPQTDTRFGWSAPGGVVALSGSVADDGHTALAAGGKRLVVDEDLIEGLARLAGGGCLGADDLAGAEGIRSPESFLMSLWRAGLVEAEGNSPSPARPQVLNAVTHADHPGFPNLETLLNEALGDWRSPQPAELPVPTAGLDIAAKPLPAAFDGLELLLRALVEANAQTFQFALTGIDAADPLLLVRYGRESAASADGAFAGDLHEAAPGRKLTFVLPLDGNPGQAGAVRFAMGSDAVTTKPGRLSVFASFRAWMLEPPAEGSCHMLLGRVHGPAFV